MSRKQKRSQRMMNQDLRIRHNNCLSESCTVILPIDMESNTGNVTVSVLPVIYNNISLQNVCTLYHMVHRSWTSLNVN